RNGFSLVETSKLNFEGYRARVLAMQGVYRALNIPVGPPPADDQTPDPRAAWLLYRFREAEPAGVKGTPFEGNPAGGFHVALSEHGAVQPVIAESPFHFRVAIGNQGVRRFLASETNVVPV